MFLQPVEYSNHRILTTQQLAGYYGTEAITLQQNFNNNKNRYTESKHYFFLQGEYLKDFLRLEIFESQNRSKIRSLYLWTERGAFLHAKSLNTDTAWDAYERLVDFYFDTQVPAPPVDFLEACGVIQPAALPMTDDEIAVQFVNAIGKALQSGEYYLVRKGAHKRKRPASGELLGCYTDTVITLISSRAATLYARAIGSHFYLRQMRSEVIAALSRSGIVVPRNTKTKIKTIDDVEYNAFCLYRDKINALPGMTARCRLPIGTQLFRGISNTW